MQKNVWNYYGYSEDALLKFLTTLQIFDSNSLVFEGFTYFFKWLYMEFSRLRHNKSVASVTGKHFVDHDCHSIHTLKVCIIEVGMSIIELENHSFSSYLFISLPRVQLLCTQAEYWGFSVGE